MIPLVMAVTRDRDLGLVGASATIATIGGLVVVAGGALATVRFVGGTPVERGLEGAMGAFALGMFVAVPGILVLLGLHDRPALLLPAAAALVPLSFLSFAGVTLPLLIPAAMLFVAYGRRTSGRPAPPGTAALTTTFVLALLVAAVAALLSHPDPRSYSTGDGSGSTSDVITGVESLVALVLAAAAVVGGWWIASPERGRGT